MVVALWGFAAGAATYLAVKPLAPALLAAEYGSMIPFLAAAVITVAGMVWMFRAWSRLREIDEAEEGLPFQGAFFALTAARFRANHSPGTASGMRHPGWTNSTS